MVKFQPILPESVGPFRSPGWSTVGRWTTHGWELFSPCYRGAGLPSVFCPWTLFSSSPTLTKGATPSSVLSRFPERSLINSGTSSRRHLEGDAWKALTRIVRHWFNAELESLRKSFYHVLASGHFCVLSQQLEAARAYKKIGTTQ